MVERKRRLTARTCANLNKHGRYSDGGRSGLYFRVTREGTKNWIFRFMLDGRAREMGLGPWPTVSLADARQQAMDAKRLLLDGDDPIEARKAARQAKRADRAAVTFAQAATRFIESHCDGWRDPRAAPVWTSSLQRFAFGVLGDMDVRGIEPEHVEAALRPIWTAKPETASRVRGRIEKILDWAKTRGYRDGENPARWKGNLDHLLPRRPPKGRGVKHHRALPWAELPIFMQRLAKVEGMGAAALAFAILTAARSGEVRGATWEEFDLGAAVWTVPPARMKAGREHRVPLSDAALELLRALPRLEGSPYVFWAAMGGKLSDMTLSAVTRRMGVDAVPHGFRSTFRDWTAEATAFPRDVCEAALAHVNADKVESAYLRSDLFERRRALMQDWAEFAAGGVRG